MRSEDVQVLNDGNKDLVEPKRTNRADAAITLKIAGATYTEIAETVGYKSATQARQAVEEALAAMSGPEDRERLRFLEARRLERLLRGLWKKATDDKDEEHLAAARVALAIIDRHSKLYGLDAPQEMVVYTPAAAEIEEWVQRQARQIRGALPEEADVIGEIVEGEIVDTGYGD